MKCKRWYFTLHNDFEFTYIAAAPGMSYFGSLSSRKILSWYHLPLATDTREKIFRLFVSCTAYTYARESNLFE